MEFLLVDRDGKILAALQSIRDVVPELARIGRDSEQKGPVRVVRHDEHYDALAGVESHVTTASLPWLLERSRSR